MLNTNKKIAIVTGANIGLGYETTIGLAQKGFKVIMACRTLEKAEHALANIVKQIPSAQLEIMLLDLSSLNSVKAFAKYYKSKYTELDILVNNAGIMGPKFHLTEDGFESQMAANYFGHFLLTGLLLPVLSATKNSRVVSLSSIAHKSGSINFEDLQGEKKYDTWKQYSQSKLACLLFAYELQRKLDAHQLNVISVAAHPGISTTNIVQNLPRFLVKGFNKFGGLFSHSAKAGAAATLLAALGKDVRGGTYYGPTGIMQMKGPAGSVEPMNKAKNEKLAKQLWEVSEKLTSFKYEF